jgi:beta-lactam-binding protein with PASTA domain
VFKFITEKPLWVNILAALGLILVLVFIFFFSLDWITGHGKEEKVPAVTGQNITAATKMLEAKGFDVEVVDSIFVDSIARLSVVKQSPEADASVKAGRTIYLTINRAIAPEVEMPSLVGFSIKSAQMMLLSLNLKMGDTSYRPDIARNAVLEQLYNGIVIKQGTKIPMGSTISFVLGSGLGGSDLDVPDLTGLTVQEALNTLKARNLGVGAISPRTAITDTLNSFVVDQTPKVFGEPQPGQKVINKLKAGQLVDIYISNTAPVKPIDSTTINH